MCKGVTKKKRSTSTPSVSQGSCSPVGPALLCWGGAGDARRCWVQMAAWYLLQVRNLSSLARTHQQPSEWPLCWSKLRLSQPKV